MAECKICVLRRKRMTEAEIIVRKKEGMDIWE